MKIKNNEAELGCEASLPSSPEARLDGGETSTFLRNLLETREFRQILGHLLPELVSVWAGDNRMKSQIAKTINRVLASGFFQPGRGQYESLRGRDFFSDEAATLLDLVAQHSEPLIRAWRAAFNEMPLAEKEVFLEKLIQHVFNGSTGNFITDMAAALNQIHGRDPEFIARCLKPGVRNWIKTTDFGELKEWAGMATRDLGAVVRLFNDELWQYPAKVVLLLALLPEAANLAVSGATDTLGRFNQVSPDLVTDIILTLMGEINGASIGLGINELTELVRKVGTGSALIGEPGSPRLPGDAARLYDEIATTLDFEKLLKARQILAEQTAAVKARLLESLKNRPEAFLEKVAQFPALKNSRISTFRHLLSVLEEMPEAEVADALEKGLAAIDTDMIAETINLAMTIVRRTRKYRPEAIANVVSRIIAEIDPDILADTSLPLMEEIFPDLISLVRPLLPGLIHGLCDALEPQPDVYEAELTQARKRLGRLICEGGQ